MMHVMHARQCILYGSEFSSLGVGQMLQGIHQMKQRRHVLLPVAELIVLSESPLRFESLVG